MNTRLLVSIWFAGLSAAGMATTLHWAGIGGSGVGDFDTASNWLEGSVPGSGDFVVIKNFATLNANWAVTFNSDVTNLKAELVASTNDYGLAFNLNGHSWTLTESAQGIHMYSGSGGTMTFSNGTIRTPFVSFVTPPSGGSTNLFLTMRDVGVEAESNLYAAVQARFEGGNQSLSNLTVGATGFGIGTLVLDAGAKVGVTNALWLGGSNGATGELVVSDGQLLHSGGAGTCYIGRDGYGALTLLGGTTTIQSVPYVGYGGAGVGVLTVAGGVNTLGTQGENKIDAGTFGHGTVLGYGGTNYAVGLNLGYAVGGYGEMILTNGTWTFGSYSWLGYFGKGVVTISGGKMYSPSVFCIGRGTGTGVVTVAGGTLEVANEVRLGGNATSVGMLTLAGDGLLKANYISEYTSGAHSSLVFDGGTLQPRSSGALIRSVDDIRVTTNGLSVNTAGYTVSITGVLQNAEGQAGRLTKLGSGTLTLASDAEVTGAVSVLGGTLKPDTGKTISLSGGVWVSGGALLDLTLAGDLDYTTASGSVSRVDGALALKDSGRLNIDEGASLSGTGSVARVTLQSGAVLSRSKSDGTALPLMCDDCVSAGALFVALSGFALDDLKASPVPLISATNAFVDVASVTVTLDGQPKAGVHAACLESGERYVLTVYCSYGTMMMLQ